MHVHIEHSPQDVERVRALVARPELQQRIVERRKDWMTNPDILTPDKVWYSMLACLVTSEQKLARIAQSAVPCKSCIGASQARWRRDTQELNWGESRSKALMSFLQLLPWRHK